MVKVGSKEFNKMSIGSKIKILVDRGYKSSAFAYLANARSFARAWKKKGYKASLQRSWGPNVEGVSRKPRMEAYYVSVFKR